MATSVWHLHEVPHEAGASPDQRRAERHAITVSRATVRGHGRDPGDAVLLDLSIYGCRIAMASEHTERDRIWLRLDGGWPIGATVVWVEDGRMGCRFDDPLPGSVMRELMRPLN